MTDWRELLDSETIGAWDLKGRSGWVAVITKVESQKMQRQGSKAQRKAKISFKGWEKSLIAGATILDTIGKLYGRDVKQWPGKAVELYATTCNSFGESGVPCVRVKNVRPTAAPVEQGPNEPVDREIQARQKAAADVIGRLSTAIKACRTPADLQVLAAQIRASELSEEDRTALRAEWATRNDELKGAG